MITNTCTENAMSYINSNSDPSCSSPVSDDLQNLKNHPLIQEYASIDNDLYKLIEATNPTLRMFIDLAKKIEGVFVYEEK